MARVAAAYERAAATHERAAELELSAAGFFERQGDLAAGRRHRAAAERQAACARADHARAAQAR